MRWVGGVAIGWRHVVPRVVRRGRAGRPRVLSGRRVVVARGLETIARPRTPSGPQGALLRAHDPTAVPRRPRIRRVRVGMAGVGGNKGVGGPLRVLAGVSQRRGAGRTVVLGWWGGVLLGSPVMRRVLLVA